MYNLIKTSFGKEVIIRDNSDGTQTSFSEDPANTDYQAFLAWLAEGNTPNPYVPPPPAIPQQVPMWAVRTVLQNDGLFDQAQALINETSDNALKNVWEYGNFADRNSRAISVLAIELSLTEAQVDQMFIDANNLSV
jgi:hypothetical protein